MAKQLITQYGVHASRRAAMKAEERLTAGDFEGFDDWMRIGRLIEDLQTSKGTETL